MSQYCQICQYFLFNTTDYLKAKLYNTRFKSSCKLKHYANFNTKLNDHIFGSKCPKFKRRKSCQYQDKKK